MVGGCDPTGSHRRRDAACPGPPTAHLHRGEPGSPRTNSLHHPSRRLLPDRYRPHCPRGRLSHVVTARPWHGRQGGRPDLRRAARRVAARAARDADLRVERGGRGSLRQRCVDRVARPEPPGPGRRPPRRGHGPVDQRRWLDGRNPADRPDRSPRCLVGRGDERRAAPGRARLPGCLLYTSRCV